MLGFAPCLSNTQMSPKGLHPARQIFLGVSTLWVSEAHEILHKAWPSLKAGVLSECAQ